MGKVNCGYCKKEIKRNSRECPHCEKKFKMFEEQERTDNFSFETINFKRIFSKSLIFSLSIGLLIGIFAFISGGLEEITTKLLITVFAIAGFSLTALCSSIWYEKKKYFISVLGMSSSVLGLFYSLLLIWNIISIHSGGIDFGYSFSPDVLKPLFVFCIISIASAYSSLLLLRYEKGKKSVKIIIVVTIGLIIMVSLALIYLIVLEGKVEEPFIKSLWMSIGLIILGTIATSIFKKIDMLDEE